MNILQRAINYETIVRTLGRSDSYVIPVFNHLMSYCDVDQPLVQNPDSFSFISGAESDVLLSSYPYVEKAFSRLQSDVQIIDNSDEFWPCGVKECRFLYLRGRKNLLGRKGLSIVGTRHSSERGMNLAGQAVNAVGKDYVVISGLAKGIDGEAHIRALKNGYDTIAVIGTNVTDCYPAEHRRLQELIAQNGLLVSQFAPTRKTENYFFINRNRLMSEIACGSLIVESGDFGGGVNQGHFSEKQGKPVFIFRGDFDSPSLHWPHDFENPIIIDSVNEISGYLDGSKKTACVQLSLF